MSEKLIVQNFADIQNIEICLNKINILIGPQASGKSICAKLLFYFKNFVWEILNAVEDGQSKRQLDSSYIKRFEEYFPQDSWGDKQFVLRYEIADTFIQIERVNEKKKLKFSYSDFYKKEISAFRKYIDKIRQDVAIVDTRGLNRRSSIIFMARDYFTDRLTQSLDRRAAFSQLFIPATRSFFAFIERGIFSFLSSNKALDPFLTTFGSFYESIKRSEIRSLDRLREKEIRNEIESLIEKILCGKYVYEKGKDFIVSEGRRVSVANSSSGQQETLPLAIIISFLATSSSRTVYVEEPEAHLFPSAQRDVIELIATVFNSKPNQLQFFITTHSPYILTAINNLLQAGFLYERTESNEELKAKLKHIVPKIKALNPSDVSAYSLGRKSCINLISEDTGLINASAIDSVSDELAIQFDKLLDLA